MTFAALWVALLVGYMVGRYVGLRDLREYADNLKKQLDTFVADATARQISAENQIREMQGIIERWGRP